MVQMMNKICLVVAILLATVLIASAIPRIPINYKGGSKCFKLAQTNTGKGIGALVPKCTKFGTFFSKQCHGSTGYCWCVDPRTGMEKPGSRKGPGKGAVSCQGQCDDERIEAEDKSSNGLVGGIIPKCTPDGFYEKEQCSGSSGYCWCVDSKTGKEIDGTARGPTEERVNC